MIIDAFGAERKVIVKFLVPWNVIELLTALVCHAFPGKTATMSAKKGSDMLGAFIYDKVIKFCFLHTIKKIGKSDKYHKKIAYHNKIKWNESSPKSIKLDFYYTFIKILINFVVTSQDKWALANKVTQEHINLSNTNLFKSPRSYLQLQ